VSLHHLEDVVIVLTVAGGAVDQLDGLPPLLIASGDAELLLDDATRFAARADAAGVDVSLEIYRGMPHGFAVLSTDSAAHLLQRVRGFIQNRLNGGVPDTPVRPLNIRRIGWAGCEITTERGTRLVVDPYLSGTEGFHSGLPESDIRPAEPAGADIIVVTHAGYDHRGQTLEIMQAGAAVLVSGTATFQAAMAAGIPSSRLVPTVSGVEFRYRDVTIKALPAQHESTMRIDGHFVADQPQSYLVTTADGSRVLCGGDFSLSEQARTWGEIYQPDIAVLGIGGVRVGAARIVELQPAEAAIAARWLGVSTVIPVHYLPGDPAPTQLAAELGTDAQVVVLEFGESWSAPSYGADQREQTGG
jgi:L-ascorbate metabolism protein UlaG (beta-lactamase superfamily)